MKFLGWSLACASVVVFGYLSACDCARAAEPATVFNVKSAATMCRCAEPSTGAMDRILEILSEPLKSTGLDFTDEPLENIVNFLSSEYEIPIHLDIPALEEAGLTADEPLNINVRNISLRSALRLLLKQKQLTYFIRNEVLIITTPEEAENELVVCVYDVRDILAHQMLPAQKGTPAGPDYDPLTDVILSCVATETWAESGGGEAEIRPLPPGLLVISQTRAVHDEIAALLTTVRETLRQPAPPALGKAGSEMRAIGNGMDGGGMGRAMDMMEGGAELGPEPTPADESPFD